MADFVLVVVGGDVVELRAGVAAVRPVAEIGIGQAQVGFVGILLGVGDLEFEFLVDAGIGVGGDQEFRQVVLEVIAGVVTGRPGEIEVLEAIGVLLDGFQQEAGAFAATADPGVAEHGVVTAIGEIDQAAEAVGDRGGHQVQCAAGGAGAGLDRRGALAHFHCAHSCHGRKVVGGRRRVGGG